MTRPPYILLAFSIAFTAASANEAVNPFTKVETKHDLPTFKMLNKDIDGFISRDDGLSNEVVAR